MKFTVVSHACLSVEHGGTSVLVDPWIVGSCYWRSWWNFPEPPAELVESLRPSFIYLTHLHWDHFHGVSLRRFPRSTPILVPKARTHRMVDDLKWLGFEDVREIPHGGSIQLGDDFRLHSFQFGLILDSSPIFEGGGTTLFDANDCKYFGLTLRDVMQRFPKIDFVLRSHSSAGALPYCIEGYETRFPNLRTRTDYIEEFSRFAIHVGARYAIPFASNHCYLHPETLRFNSIAVNPAEVAARCNALAREVGAATECVVMPPGSTWSSERGFELQPFDYAKRNEYIEDLRRRHQAKLDRTAAQEAEEVGDFDAFRTYFEKFLRAAIPYVIRSWMLEPFGFRVRDAAGDRVWLVNPRDGLIEERAEAPPGTIVFQTAAKILNDCTRLKMFSTWTASKRLSIVVPRDEQIRVVNALVWLLDLYELDLLPLTNNLEMRSLSVYSRRWREAVEVARLAIRHGLLRKPFVVKDLYPIAASDWIGPTGRVADSASRRDA